MNILVSACLLGINCRYDGKDNFNKKLYALKEKHNLIPVCPEVYGGMTTPRAPSEIKGDNVISKAGDDVTDYFKKGAEETLKLAKMFNCQAAILKEKSPSCGYGKIYDGTFTGITADLLTKNGISVIGESEIEKLL